MPMVPADMRFTCIMPIKRMYVYSLCKLDCASEITERTFCGTCRQQRPDPAVAVPAGAVDRPSIQRDNRVDDVRRRVQTAQCRDGRADVGSTQEQANDEL